MANSNSAGDLEIYSTADDEEQYTDGSYQHLTVSTWPINCLLTQTTTVSLQTGWYAKITYDSESANKADLGNGAFTEYLSASAFPAPPFDDPEDVDGGYLLSASGGSTVRFPTPPLLLTNNTTDHVWWPDESFNAGTGLLTIIQQFQFKDTVLNTTWQAISRGIYTQRIYVSANPTGPGRVVTVQEYGETEAGSAEAQDIINP